MIGLRTKPPPWIALMLCLAVTACLNPLDFVSVELRGYSS
jgi:hypothetical protein